MRAARVVGWAATIGALIFLFAVQVRSGDWLPPDISMSQYGVGPDGWLFSAFLICVSVAGVAWSWVGPVGRVAKILVLIGAVGGFIGALIPTDPGGLQQSLNAAVHTAGSVVLVSAMPFGLWALAAGRSRGHRLLATVLLVLSAVALVLLLLAAAGWDTAGIGPQASWAWWQAVAMLAQVAMMVQVAVVRGGRSTRVSETTV